MDKFPSVLLVTKTTGYQTRSFGDAAAKLGVRLIFATDRCDHLEDPWRDHAIPVRFHDESYSVRIILNELKQTPPVGVLAVGDRPMHLAASVTQVFGLQGNTLEAVGISRNKLATRQALKAAELPVPWFRAVSVDSDIVTLAQEVSYPCVLKPLALSGSRGVIRADTPSDFVEAFVRVRHVLQEPDVQVERDSVHDLILVEGFIQGREYAIEALLDRGRMRTLAIFEKPNLLDGPFFEETIYVTPPALGPNEEGQLREAVVEAAQAIGLWHGPVHAECRVNANGVFILEVAARPIGGLCARALRFVSEGNKTSELYTLEELLLHHAIGHDIGRIVREPDASGVMMLPIQKRGVLRKITGMAEALDLPYVEDLQITAKLDQQLIPLPEGSSYLGFVFSRAKTPSMVVKALRSAEEKLNFTIERDVPMC